MKYALLITVAVVLGACAAPSAYSVDSQFTESEMAIVQDALAQRCGGLESVITDRRQRDTWHIEPGEIRERQTALGVTDFETFAVTLNRSAIRAEPNPSRSLLSTSLHEIGHTLGLDHSDDPESTMYSKTTRTCVDDVTAAAVGCRGTCED